LPIDRVAGQARQLENQGYREIVVTGIEISSYGRGLAGGPTLTDALQAIGDAAPNARVRLSSLDPRALTGDFCAALPAIRNLCGHFHLSLQSGCDDTLRRMGRKYDAGPVLESISALRRLFPGCAVTADLITGFPGETDDEFGQTLRLIKSAEFSDMHIFPFSPRPGTPASEMPGQISKAVRRERARIAAKVAEEMAHAFRLGQVGKTLEVLFERRRLGHWVGHSGNYIEVTAKSGGAQGALHRVLITDVQDGTVWGEIITAQTKGG
jgi:threonylcarbamoyladenosine tRNA methylthiotransferase MtaB